MVKMRIAAIPGLLMIACAMSAMSQNHAPVAVIKVTSGQTITDNRIKVNANEQVCFNGLSSSDSDGNTLTYSWDFGDGTTKSTSNSPCHKFTTDGIYTVRLIVNDGVIDTTSKSLLAGMTPSNYTLPAGWTLVLADGAENGVPAGIILDGTTHISAMGSNNPIGYPCVAHTGTHAYCDSMFHDGSTTQVYVKLPNGYHEVYMSMWDYTDPSALYGNSDYEYLGVYGTHNSIINIQAQTNYLDTASSINGLYWPLHAYIANREYFWYNGPFLTPAPPIDAGIWRQFEMLCIPNTAFTPDTVYTPPGNCTSPSQPGCGNGTVKVWINGTLALDAENVNLNDSNAAYMTTNAYALIGGYITSFASGGDATRCKTFSMNGGGSCPGTQPGTGGPRPFYRYLDDIIVLTK